MEDSLQIQPPQALAGGKKDKHRHKRKEGRKREREREREMQLNRDRDRSKKSYVNPSPISMSVMSSVLLYRMDTTVCMSIWL